MRHPSFTETVSALQPLYNLFQKIFPNHARHLGLNAVLFTSGTESVSAAFDEAVKITNDYAVLQAEKQFYRELLYNESDSILVLKENGDVFKRNYPARTQRPERQSECRREKAGNRKINHLALSEVKDPDASIRGIKFVAMQASGYLTLAAVAKYPCKHGYLARCFAGINGKLLKHFIVFYEKHLLFFRRLCYTDKSKTPFFFLCFSFMHKA